MELKPGQYESAVKLVKTATEALQSVSTCLKRRDEPSRVRRGIEEVESLLKKVKHELRIG